MKIAAWNVNSLKVRLPHLLDWLAEAKPDVLCLQELKLEDHNFPRRNRGRRLSGRLFRAKNLQRRRAAGEIGDYRCRLRQPAISGRTEAPDFRHRRRRTCRLCLHAEWSGSRLR
jgi:endonuclease/exonuclease/phosphatase family metal-dependent hydrolase